MKAFFLVEKSSNPSPDFIVCKRGGSGVGRLFVRFSGPLTPPPPPPPSAAAAAAGASCLWKNGLETPSPPPFSPMDGSIGREGGSLFSFHFRGDGREGRAKRGGRGRKRQSVAFSTFLGLSLSFCPPPPHPFPYQSGHNYADTEQKKLS